MWLKNSLSDKRTVWVWMICSLSKQWTNRHRESNTKWWFKGNLCLIQSLSIFELPELTLLPAKLAGPVQMSWVFDNLVTTALSRKAKKKTEKFNQFRFLFLRTSYHSRLYSNSYMVKFTQSQMNYWRALVHLHCIRLFGDSIRDRKDIQRDNDRTIHNEEDTEWI